MLDTVQQQGPLNTYRKAMNQLDSYTPLGYSLAGVVVEVGAGAEEFRVGQLVACAGNEFALHAEINWVTSQPLRPGTGRRRPHLAAFATVGSIATPGRPPGRCPARRHCVRNRARAGRPACRPVARRLRGKVVGLDTVTDRCRLAEKAGASCAPPGGRGPGRDRERPADASGGLGADQVFLVPAVVPTGRSS